MYLAIDTATESLSIALSEGSELVGELTWRSRQNHTVELIPTLNYLLDRAKTDLGSLTGIIVAKGPGSFTGLRIGITTAKGLAISIDVPLVGISTLEAWAYPYAGTGLPVCPLQEAGRGEIAAASYRWRNGQSERLTAEHITTVEDLCQHIQEPTIFCGKMSASTRAALRERLAEKALVMETQVLTSRAAYMGELGRLKIERGELDDPSTLQPLYLRRPSITEPARATKKQRMSPGKRGIL